jgi:hypothetical protein
MNTPSEQDFSQLRRLLSLKRHEQPPPGYFDALPRQIIASLQAQSTCRDADTNAGVPAWILNLIARVQARPALAGLVGAGFCALILGTVIFLEKDSQRPQAMPSVLADIASSSQPAPTQETSGTVLQPVMAEAALPLTASNQWQATPAPSLFDLTPGLNTAPVSHRP